MSRGNAGRLTLPSSIFGASSVAQVHHEEAIAEVEQGDCSDVYDHDDDQDIPATFPEASNPPAGLSQPLSKKVSKQLASVDILTPVLLTYQRLLQSHKRLPLAYTRGDYLHLDEWPPSSHCERSLVIDIDVDDDGSVAYRLDQEGQIPLIPDLDLMQSLGRLEARIRSESSRLSSHQPSNAKMLVADSPLL